MRGKINRRSFSQAMAFAPMSFIIPWPDGARQGEPPVRLSYELDPPPVAGQKWMLCVANSDGRIFEYPVIDPKNIEVPMEAIPKNGGIKMWIRGFVSFVQP